MKKLLILLCTVFIFSCSTFVDVKHIYPAKTEPDPELGYLFGKLAINSKAGNFALEFVNTVNSEEKPVILRFIKYTDNINSAGLTVVSVAPGTYRLKNVLYIVGNTKLYSQKEITIPEVSEEFTVQAGDCCYIGHWFAAFTRTYTPDGGQSVVWQLDSITDQRDLAVSDLAKEYPLLSDLKQITFFPEEK